MKNIIIFILHRSKFVNVILGCCILLAAGHFLFNQLTDTAQKKRLPFPTDSHADLHAERSEYFFRLLRDPATNHIPPRIRARELGYARKIALQNKNLKKAGAGGFTWFEAGPNNIGGRTRALAVDVTNPNVLLAGGTSGGIWKSVDRGRSWALKNDPSQNLSVTSLAQDPRPGHTNVWYYTSGEFRGQSAADRGFRALFFGNGVYKSTDNGETWHKLLSTDDEDATLRESPFDYLSKVVISPTTGSVFLASNHYGIYRSEDDGRRFDFILGEKDQYRYSDVAVAPDGKLLAVHSSDQSTTGFRGPHVFLSTDDGQNWSDVTPVGFQDFHDRSLIAFAPSNPDIAYIFTTYRQQFGDTIDERNFFYKLFLSQNFSEDASDNLPNFFRRFGRVRTQNSYNMALAVKPDDENFVVLGGTSLFRSRDGFLTPVPRQEEEFWIGGYPYDTERVLSLNTYHFPNLLYENHHPDQHIAVFDPHDPNTLLSGHDGGLSITSDITAVPVKWQRLNNNYNVTQFYTVAISQQPGDNRIMGGTQDNGTPFLRWQENVTVPAFHVGMGDGSYAYMGEQFAYVSSQRGWIFRLDYDSDLNPIPTGLEASDIPRISPPRDEEDNDRLFIHPYMIDPNDENVMYYPAGQDIWRNNHLSAAPPGEDSFDPNWLKIASLNLPSDYLISTLAISHQPQHVLYVAASSRNGTPRLFRLETANTGLPQLRSRNLPSAPSGAYIHSIVINPDDADELIVALSNYNVKGLYHSQNGGFNFSFIEGNLEGSMDLPGPSIRSATILPFQEETYYLLGTSTGLYATTRLDGDNTIWEQQAADLIGNTVVEYVASRKSDGTVAVATHGRGLFVGSIETLAHREQIQPATVTLEQNYPNPVNPSTSIPFTISESGTVEITFYDIRGRKVGRTRPERMNAGRYEIPIDLSDFASGVYVYRLDFRPDAASQSVVSRARKIMVMK